MFSLSIFSLLSAARSGKSAEESSISVVDDFIRLPSVELEAREEQVGDRGNLRSESPSSSAAPCVPSPSIPGLLKCASLMHPNGCGSSAGMKDQYYVDEFGILGEGAFGKVKPGTHRRTGQPVAVKMIAGVSSTDVAAYQRLFREVRMTMSVSGANQRIIQMHQAYLYRDGACFVMEKVDGRELLYELGLQPKESTLGGPSYYSSRRGRMGEQQARGFVRQVLEGLQEAHSRGVSWNDLKLENVMVGKDGGVKLIDWGLAENFTPGGVSEDGLQLPDPEISWAASGSAKYVPQPWLQTVIRFAREQEENGHTRTKKKLMVPPRGQDLYAAGVVLFKLLHGYDVDPTFRRSLSPAEGSSLGSGIAAASPGSAFRAPVLASYLMSDLCADFLTKLLTSSSELSTAGLALQHPWFSLPLPDMRLQIINNLRRPELRVSTMVPPGWFGFVRGDLARVERELLPSVSLPQDAESGPGESVSLISSLISGLSSVATWCSEGVRGRAQ